MNIKKTSSFITAKKLIKRYGMGDAVVNALTNVSFRVKRGEFVSIMGESGSGKSTLLSILGAMSSPTSGELSIDDINIYRLNGDKRSDFRREYLGFVFQSFHLLPYLSVVENVMLPLATYDKSKKMKREMAEETLIRVGLKEKINKLPGEISGGQKERVAIARAIVNNPPLLLADEPTGNLDTATSHEIMSLLRRLNCEGTTIIMVTHSRDAASFGHRLLNMSDGKMTEQIGQLFKKN